MKKIISFTLCMVMVISLLCFAVNAASTVSIVASESGFEDKAQIDKVTKDGVTVTFSKGTGNNAPVYYVNGNAFRVYGGNTMTVSAEGTITSITLTLASANNLGELSANTGTYTVNKTTGTWTGSASEVVFTNTASSGHARIQVIDIEIGGSSTPPTTTEATEPDPEPTYTTPEEIVNALYQLEKGKVLPGGPYTLEGVIKSVDTKYNPEYGNVTVTMIVGEMTDKPVQCFRLEGEHAPDLAVGDKIKVKGELKRYNDTYEFDAKCQILEYTKGQTTQPEPTYTTPEEIINAAYALEQGAALNGTYTLSGTITAVNTIYSERYGNVTVTMAVDGFEDKPIQCFRMINGSGVEAVDKIGVGDKITVTGTLKNYNGTIEFDANCTLDAYTIVEKEPEVIPTTPEEILAALYALQDQESLAGPFTLTGKVKSIDTEYSQEYGNVTVTIVVDGFENYPVQCYRLEGNGADKVAVGDTITVTGSFKNYKGTYEFVQGCTLDKLVAADRPADPGTSPDTSDASVIAAVVAVVVSAGAAALVIKKKH
ncbi:MAG: hypothetical protein J6330_07510 [Clostridia bacterium]|nr:hypothetical protein [Clostridia bacterium]